MVSCPEGLNLEPPEFEAKVIITQTVGYGALVYIRLCKCILRNKYNIFVLLGLSSIVAYISDTSN